MKSRLRSPTGPCMTCPPAHPTSLTLCPPFSHSQPIPKTLTSLQARTAFPLVGPSVWNALPGILTLGPVLPSGRGGKVTLSTRPPRARRKSGHTLRPHGPPSPQPALLSRHHWHAGLLPAVVFTAVSPELRMVPHT